MLNECLRKSAFCFSSSTQYVLLVCERLRAKKRGKGEKKKWNGKEKREMVDENEDEDNNNDDDRERNAVNKWKASAMEWSTDGI